MATNSRPAPRRPFTLAQARALVRKLRELEARVEELEHTSGQMGAELADNMADLDCVSGRVEELAAEGPQVVVVPEGVRRLHRIWAHARTEANDGQGR